MASLRPPFAGAPAEPRDNKQKELGASTRKSIRDAEVEVLNYQPGLTVGRLCEADDCGFGQGCAGAGGGSSGEGGPEHHRSQGAGSCRCRSVGLRQEALLDERF